MANALYPKAKKAAFSGGANVNLLVGAVKAVLVDTGAYTYAAAHEFLSDIPSGARISTTGAASGKTLSDLGAFDCDNLRFESVPAGTSVEAVVFFVDTGSPTTSRLIWYQDTGITNMPVADPGGASFNLIIDAAGVFVI